MGNGTNYYLYGVGEPCPTCGHAPARDKVHVGRATYGWVFLWRGYRGETAAGVGRELSTPEQWWEFLQQQTDVGAVIRDEYDEEMSLSELRAVVALRAENLVDGLPPRRHSRAVSAGDSDVMFGLFPDRTP